MGQEVPKLQMVCPCWRTAISYRGRSFHYHSRSDIAHLHMRHTWEYWGCAAGQGAFFQLSELEQGPYLSFQLWAPG